jgi:hypothetical protein
LQKQCHTIPGTIKITKDDAVKHYKKLYLSAGYNEKESNIRAEFDYHKMVAKIQKTKEKPC